MTVWKVTNNQTSKVTTALDPNLVLNIYEKMYVPQVAGAALILKYVHSEQL